MNQSNGETSAMQLPPPVMEKTPQEAGSSASPAEKAPAGAERVPAPEASPAAAMPAVPAIPLPTPPVLPATSAQDSASTVQGLTLPLDDGDLIEKEWVNKAKQIVERTRDDPHKQSEELTIFKADYMKKRYGKAIKLSQ